MRFHHLTHLAKGVLDAEQLIPFLQQIRHRTSRQLQPLIGRHELEAHSFSLGIDPTWQQEFAEHSLEPPFMGLC